MRFFLSKRLGWGIRVGVISEPVHPFRRHSMQYNAIGAPTAPGGALAQPMLWTVFGALLGLLLVVLAVTRYAGWHF